MAPELLQHNGNDLGTTNCGEKVLCLLAGASDDLNVMSMWCWPWALWGV